MRKFIVVMMCWLGLVASPVWAGPGHDHDHGHAHGPVTAEKASAKAMKKVEQLAQSGKVDASWVGLKPALIEQKAYANGPEWVVTFRNTQVKDADKQILYLFYSLDGHYIAANHTGQ